VWPEFARSMAPPSHVVAQETAKLFKVESEMRVLDVAASHGTFGIAVVQRNNRASIVALDWPTHTILSTFVGFDKILE
jgi:ubiquinone/menaquinone biosynthesis C-methylase UbiE